MSAAHDFITESGECAELLRRMDWSGRSVGPPGHWPQSLRTALSICLASRHPICILWGREYLYLYNDAYAPIVGAKHPAAQGALYPEVWPEIWESDIRPVLEPVMRTGVASWADNLLLVLERHGYKEECYFSFSFAPIRDESGQVGGVFTAITETTPQVVDRRRLKTLSDLGARTAESRTPAEACRAAAAVLAENRYEFPFALVYLVDRAGEAAGLVECIGLPPGTASAPSAVDLAGREAQDPWHLRRAWEEGDPVVLESGVFPGVELSGGPWPERPRTALTLPISRPGQQRAYGFLVCGISPRRALDGQYRDFLVLAASQIAMAVSNAMSYEEERRRAESLAELDRAKTIFFSNVSHEFRTPLALMLGPIDDCLADRADPLPAVHAQRLETVQRNSLRLLKLVNTLLDFSRIEAGRVQALYEPTDLAGHTAELASNFRSAMEKAGLAFEVECPPLREPVYVDREMWEKVVLNFLSNAFKFTFQGRVRVSLRDAGAFAELAIEDTGEGIPSSELAHLFTRFHRIQGTRSRSHEGTGIGLALVKELVSLHGGTVRVASKRGHGTVFTVSIPFGYAHLPADRLGGIRSLPSTALRAEAYVQEALRWLPGSPGMQSAAASGDDARAASAGASRILIVDDNTDMRDYLQRLLNGRWRTVTAADGEEALAAARRERPDLVLSDIMMPRLDGFGLLTALRADPALHDVPVIFISARAGEEARIESIDAGADDYLVKPFSGRELIARVEAQLMRAKLREAQHELDRRLARVFRHAPMGICLLRGPEHVVEYANKDYLRLLSGRPILGKPLRQALPELSEQGIFELLDKVFATGQPHIGQALRTLLHDPGSPKPRERFFDFVYQPLPDDNGLVEGIAVVVHEVAPPAGAAARPGAPSAPAAGEPFASGSASAVN